MKPAFYMRFVAGHHGSLDRVGGVPTHLPHEFPRSANTGEQMGFLGQFYCSPDRIQLEGSLCIHLYQGLEDYEPIPVAVVLPNDATLNSSALGTPKPGVPHLDIHWEYREDPDSFENWQTELAASKAGGVCYFSGALTPDETLLFEVDESPVGFNFGGYTVIVVKTVEGTVQARLA